MFEKYQKGMRNNMKVILFMPMVFAFLLTCATVTFADSTLIKEKPAGKVMAREEKTLDLLTKIDAFTEEDEALRMDSAKAHYNMGNIYYQKGEYEIAAREYYQAVTLMPDDPDAHFNLAFVSFEYLKDFHTALKHYQLYLYLKPDAEDANFVKEKIMNARMVLKSLVDSPLEKQD